MLVAVQDRSINKFDLKTVIIQKINFVDESFKWIHPVIDEEGLVHKEPVINPLQHRYKVLFVNLRQNGLLDAEVSAQLSFAEEVSKSSKSIPILINECRWISPENRLKLRKLSDICDLWLMWIYVSLQWRW